MGKVNILGLPITQKRIFLLSKLNQFFRCYDGIIAEVSLVVTSPGVCFQLKLYNPPIPPFFTHSNPSRHLKPEESVNISTYSYPPRRAERSRIPQEPLSGSPQNNRRKRASEREVLKTLPVSASSHHYVA